jgi:hypothetical protein
MPRREKMLYHIVGNVRFPGLIERPMDAEIDPALAIFYISFGKRSESGRQERPDIAGAVLGHPVEFTGQEGEGNTVGTVKFARHLKECAAEAGVPDG